MAAKGDDHGLLLDGEHGRVDLLGTHASVAGGGALAPFLDGGGADPVPTGKGSYARFTPLYGATDCLCRCGAAVENLAHSSSLAA